MTNEVNLEKKKAATDDAFSHSISSTDDDGDENFLGFSSNVIPSLLCHDCGDDFSMATTSSDNTTTCELKKMLKSGMRWHCPSCLNIPHGKTQATKVDKPVPNPQTSTVSAAKPTMPVPPPPPSLQRVNLVNSNRKVKPCYYYRKGYCRHGNSGKTVVNGRVCNFLHPKKCTKFCKFGYDWLKGCNSRSCNLFHPELCSSSVEYGVCYNQRCTLQHLHETARPSSFAPVRSSNIMSHAPPDSFNQQRMQNKFIYSQRDFPPLPVENNFQGQRNAWEKPLGSCREYPLDKLFSAIKDLQIQNSSIKDQLKDIRVQHGINDHVRNVEPAVVESDQMFYRGQEQHPKNFMEKRFRIQN